MLVTWFRAVVAADHERVGDLWVRVALDDQLQHLELARRQLAALRCCGIRRLREVADELGGESRIDDRSAACDVTDAVDQLSAG